MNCIHERIWISEADFASWLHKAAAGSAIIYHRGFLAIDTAEAISPLSPEERLQLVRTATAAYRAAEDGSVHLLQRRLGSHCFSYTAVRRGCRRNDSSRRTCQGTAVITGDPSQLDEAGDLRGSDTGSPARGDVAAELQVRHLLARYAISRSLAAIIAEHAFGIGRSA